MDRASISWQGVILALLLLMMAVAPKIVDLTQRNYEVGYDLIVVGSEPEAIAAAVSGARNGLSTLMIDTKPELGGLMTRGWLNTIDMNYAPVAAGKQREILNKGIFLEFFNRVEGDSFDVGTAQKVFNDLVAKEENLQVELAAKKITPLLIESEGRRIIEGIELVNSSGETKAYRCQRIIDATQDADIAAAAGVPFSYGQEDIGYPHRNMAATLVFRLAGVSESDWQQLRQALTNDGDPISGSNQVSAWGFWEEMLRYEPQNPRLRVRGLNIGRQNDGSILINALQIFDVNPLDKESREAAKKLAEQELAYLVPYLNAQVPGLGNAYLDGVAPELYVRDSRHIYGLYRLTIDDVLENRDFDDRVAFGSYPVDMQAGGVGQEDYIIGNPKQYAVPFRALVPKGVDNLLVVGRGASFDSLAHGSARVIPVGMATGQAAGAAAAISIEHGVFFPQMADEEELIAELQARLNKQGMELKPFTAKPEWNRQAAHWAYPGLKFLRRHGLVWGGYDNQYGLNNEMTLGEFLGIWQPLTEIYQLEKPPAEFNYHPQDKLTGNILQDIFARYRQNTARNIENTGVLTRGEAYMLIKSFLEAE